jgi:hypothetical protein
MPSGSAPATHDGRWSSGDWLTVAAMTALGLWIAVTLGRTAPAGPDRFAMAVVTTRALRTNELVTARDIELRAMWVGRSATWLQDPADAVGRFVVSSSVDATCGEALCPDVALSPASLGLRPVLSPRSGGVLGRVRPDQLKTSPADLRPLDRVSVWMPRDPPKPGLADRLGDATILAIVPEGDKAWSVHLELMDAATLPRLLAGAQVYLIAR